VESPDWSALIHAYGAADAVPGLIAMLADPDPQRRAYALDQLSMSIVHQGSVYSASAPAVPLIAEILRTGPQYVDRAGVLELLSEIAGGSGYYQVHASFLRTALAAPEDLEARISEEDGWVRDAHNAVHAEVAVLRQCLRDEEPTVRTQASHCLAVAQCDDPETQVALLEVARSDPSPQTAAGALASHYRLFDNLDAIRSFVESPIPAVAALAASICFNRGESPLTVDEFVRTLVEGRGGLVDVPALVSGPFGVLNHAFVNRPNDAFEALRKLMSHQDPEIRLAACYASQPWLTSDRAASHELVGSLGNLVTDSSSRVRFVAISHIRLCPRQLSRFADQIAQCLELWDPNVPAHLHAYGIALLLLTRLGDSRAYATLRMELEHRPNENLAPAIREMPAHWASAVGDLLIRVAGRMPDGSLGTACILALDKADPRPQGANDAITRCLERGVSPGVCIRILASRLARTGNSRAKRAVQKYQTHRQLAVDARLAVAQIGNDLRTLQLVIDESLAAPGRGKFPALRSLVDFPELVAANQTVVLPLLESDDEWLRMHAVDCLWKASAITPEDAAATALTLLSPRPVGMEAARLLLELPASTYSQKLDFMRSMVDSPKVSFASADPFEVAEKDEAFRDLIGQLLARSDEALDGRSGYQP
jgi:hypothetical protein